MSELIGFCVMWTYKVDNSIDQLHGTLDMAKVIESKVICKLC